MLWYVVIAGSLGVAAAIGAVMALAALRRRYASLLAAVELCSRQLTELRTAVDRERAAVDQIRSLLSETVAPGVARLERARSLAQAARELERSVERGVLEPRGASALIEQLERLEAEVLAGERGY
jgi:cobalamin biosynthesis protein CobT